jgi:hypothetical protein
MPKAQTCPAAETYFAELRRGEVRRIPLLRASVNKGKKRKGANPNGKAKGS